MRQGTNNRRSRGRNTGRRSGVPSKNQTFESSGPESHIRIRGNASQVHEKYVSLARDAMNAGERILAENFFQHAEHYYRVVASINEASGQGDQQNAGQSRNESQDDNWSGGQGGNNQNGNGQNANGQNGNGQSGNGQNGNNQQPNADFASEQSAGQSRNGRTRSNGEHQDQGNDADFASDPREAEAPASRGRRSAAKESASNRASADTSEADASSSSDQAAGDAEGVSVTIERQARPRRRSTARSRRPAAGADTPAGEVAGAEVAAESAPAASDND